jgi:hypothetical protein
MIKLYSLIVLCLFFMLFSSIGLAMVYADFSNEEFFAMRGAISHAGEEEQQAYRQEWHRRLEKMSQEEKKKFGLNAEDANEMTPPDKKIPFVIQGKGYEKGTGIVIQGGGAGSPGGKGKK